MRTQKDWEITICAITKSVIESGADPTTWDDRIRQGLKIVLTLTAQAMAHKPSTCATETQYSGKVE